MSTKTPAQIAREKDIKNKLSSGIKEEFTQRNFPWYQGVALKGGVGSVLGYCAGVFAKQISDVLIWWGGISFSLLGFLHYAQYITINFKKIDADIFHLFAKAMKNEEGGFMRNIKKFMLHTVPMMTGFSAAFYHAWENHH